MLLIALGCIVGASVGHASVPFSQQRARDDNTQPSQRQRRQTTTPPWQCPASTAPIASWVLDASHVSAQGSVTPVVGSWTAVDVNDSSVTFGQDPSALVFDGTSFLQVNGVSPSNLPTRDITMTAWVLLTNTTRWGGIIGYVQDNGSYEKGFLLTYHNSQFGVAVSPASDLSYMYGGPNISLNTWTHVAGTWDGSTLSLYVDGTLVNTQAMPGSAIAYPAASMNTVMTLGSYHDLNEHYPLNGQLRSVSLYNRSLTAHELLAEYRMGGVTLPCMAPPPPASGQCTAAGAPMEGWVLDSQHVTHTGAVTATFGSMTSQLVDLAGNPTAASFALNPDSLVFNNGSWVQVQGASASTLPTRDISVEAWVMLQNGTRWGGIAGYVEDNGVYERGFVLTYHNSQFGFAVSVNGSLPYMYGGPQYEFGVWYHVMGTWDGVTLSLYVDGTLVQSQPLRGTAISYPDASYQTLLTLGSYHDTNEHYQLDGQLRQVMLYNRSLSAVEVMTNYQLGIVGLPCINLPPPPPPICTLSTQPLDGWVLNRQYINSVGNVSATFGNFYSDVVDAQSIAFASNPEALRFDGTSYVQVHGASPTNLPSRDMTVEAWVLLTAGHRWGGIVSYIQDNGSYEKGFLLTYHNSQFGFAVASPRLEPYLYGGSNYTLNTWYHVAGTWDGVTMKLYVNGVLVASQARAGSAIQYPDASYSTLLTIGNYKDANEHYPLQGEIAQAMLYNRPLSLAELASRYQEGQAQWPCVVPPAPCSAASNPLEGFVLDRQYVTLTGSVSPAFGIYGATVLVGASSSSSSSSSGSGSHVAFAEFPEALLFDGTSYVQVHGASQATLPQRDITVEAWVLLNSTSNWGGIINYVQDNGAYEKGFVLTYYNRQFAFAVAAPRLDPYLFGGPSIQLNTWYHVVGTWDGVTMKLYVDGTMVASIARSGAAIQYPDGEFPPPQTVLNIGRYQDANENYTLNGQIRTAMVYSRSLSASEIASNYQRGVASLRCLAAPPPAPPMCSASLQPLDGWVLDALHVSSSNASVTPVFGTLPGTVVNSSGLTFNPTPGSMLFDGVGYVQVNGASPTNLPSRDITVEAWVLLSNTTRWGGIVSYIQDNGSYEKGFLLTYHNSQFGFAVASPRLEPYLYGGPQYELNTWYHVAGTWDGVTMKLYVNGVLVASQARAGSAIQYPDASYTTLLTIGNYKDANEHYPLQGQMRSAMLYARVLSATDLLARFNEGNIQLPCVPLPMACTPASVPMEGFVLDRAHVQSSGQVSSVFGNRHATVVNATMPGGGGGITFGTSPQALKFNGVSYVQVHGASPTNLPSRDITVEAWVLLTNTTRWGGIMGYIQDNGDYEKGFVLTYHNSQFGFAVASPRLDPYLYGGPSYQLNRWYHVVGTWDGVTMCLYVNGSKVATMARAGSAIQYPDASYNTQLTLGKYQDANENWPLVGQLRSTMLYHRALSPNEVMSNFQLGGYQTPCVQSGGGSDGGAGGGGGAQGSSSSSPVVAVVVVLVLLMVAGGVYMVLRRGRSGSFKPFVSHSNVAFRGLSLSADNAVSASDDEGEDDDVELLVE